MKGEFRPERCWVGDKQKICYASEAEAEGAARLAEREHGLAAGTLEVYCCEFGERGGSGEHWHLANQ